METAGFVGLDTGIRVCGEAGSGMNLWGEWVPSWEQVVGVRGDTLSRKGAGQTERELGEGGGTMEPSPGQDQGLGENGGALSQGSSVDSRCRQVSGKLKTRRGIRE